MDLSKISSKTLSNLIRLTKRKDGLLKQVEKIENQLLGLMGGKTSVARTGRKATKAVRGGRRKRRSALKDQVFAVVKQAGKTGMSVKEIAQKIKIKPQNLHVWFSTTGKKFSQLSKVGQGRYRLKS